MKKCIHIGSVYINNITSKAITTLAADKIQLI